MSGHGTREEAPKAIFEWGDEPGHIDTTTNATYDAESLDIDATLARWNALLGDLRPKEPPLRSPFVPSLTPMEIPPLPAKSVGLPFVGVALPKRPPLHLLTVDAPEPADWRALLEAEPVDWGGLLALLVILAPEDATFAAEAIGRAPREFHDTARTALLDLLAAPEAYVREGAILGLGQLPLTDEVREALRRLAKGDESPTVQEAARDTLEDQP